VGIQSFASHLDPADLVLILNDSGFEGWELVAIAPVTDYHLPELLAHAGTMQEPATPVQDLDGDEVEEVIPVEAFRYIFKRPLK
jgi:hypothetical protein